jgi:polyhydroxybutyrate depolymerase
MGAIRHILSALLVAGFAASAMAGEQRTLGVGTAQRGYYIHAPANLPQNASLVIMLHGAGGNGKHAAESYGWVSKADEARFLLIAPDASTALPNKEANFLRNPRAWNDSSGRGGPNITSSDDIGFLRTLIDEASRQYGIDRKRVYVTGFSSGSSMTQRVGVDMTSEIAAIAPVAGYLSARAPTLARGMPVIYILGDADPLAPYKGGAVQYPWGNRVDFMEPAGLIPARWAGFNACPESAASRPYEGVRLERWRNCRDGVEVAFYTIEGMGHHWPGSERGPLMERNSGPSKNPFRAVDLIWDFFRRWSLP